MHHKTSRSKKPAATYSIDWKLLHVHFRKQKLQTRKHDKKAEEEREISLSKLDNLAAFIKSVVMYLPPSESLL